MSDLSEQVIQSMLGLSPTAPIGKQQFQQLAWLPQMYRAIQLHRCLGHMIHTESEISSKTCFTGLGQMSWWNSTPLNTDLV